MRSLPFRISAFQYARLTALWLGMHLRAAMSFPKAFLLQVFGMMLNDGAFILFWYLIFYRFADSLHARGLQVEDALRLWSLVALSFAYTHIFAGGVRTLHRTIIEGRLDLFLLYPKQPLITAALSRTSLSSWGDLLFAWLTYLIFVDHSVGSFLFLNYLSLLSAITLASFIAIINCLTFFVGMTEQISETFIISLISFSTYPEEIYGSKVRILFYTIIPAALMAYMPANALRHFTLPLFLEIHAAAIAGAALAAWIFRIGRRRYASGNLFLTLQ